VEEVGGGGRWNCCEGGRGPGPNPPGGRFWSGPKGLGAPVGRGSPGLGPWYTNGRGGGCDCGKPGLGG
jgi:hypothetical protein